MTIKTTNLKETMEWLKNLDEELEKKLLTEVTHEAHEKAIKYAAPHRRKGHMEAAIKRKIKKNEGEIYIDDIGMLVDWRGQKVNYAAFVLFGTRPHEIKPKNKKTLRFFYKGVDEFVFRKKVHHPGYRGDDFMYRAIKDTFKQLDEIYKRIKI